jgi:ubiquinone/menaquinone biosynthesis C-methylase UbiE
MPSTMTKPLDPARQDAFADRLVGVMNDAALALMISVGHRTKLFDAMAGRDPSTSEEIAATAGLDERYVREWLGAMTTGGVVEADGGGRFHLPAEHAAHLTTDAHPANIAGSFQWIGVLAGVEDQIVRCFREGGGVPYSAYPRFHEVMAEESDQTVVAALTDAILPLVPGLGSQLETGIDVLEVGIGCGRALNQMAATFPRSRFTGYDLSEEAIATARREAEERGLTNVRFEARDVSMLDDLDVYDLALSFDVVHDQARPADLLEGLHRALRPDGVYLMQDIRAHSHAHHNTDLPLGTFGYTISCMHCMTVSLAQGGAGLGAMWGEQTALSMLADAGFGEVAVHQLEHDILNNYYVARPAPDPLR